MEFKGTKSKWEISGSQKTFVYALNEKGTNSFSLNINNDGRTPIEEQQANALLISKAPELLSKLQTILSMYIQTDKPSVRIILETQELIKSATEL